MNRRNAYTACTAVALVALIATSLAIAAPSANPLSQSGSRSGAPAAFGGGQIVVEVVFDRALSSGRVRQERYWTKGANGQLTLLGVATIRYVDFDRDGSPDPDEVISFSMN